MRKKMFISIVSFLSAIGFLQSLSTAMPISEAIEKIANRLQDKQLKTGLYAGCWSNEYGFTGSLTAGMASAYNLNCNEVYKSSAELGGNSIFLISQGSFLGDESYALTILSKNSTDPNNNQWRNALVDFYNAVKYSEGGTENYIQYIQDICVDHSYTVLYLSHYVLGAYYVDANDKKIWRQELISFLSQVNDTSNYPVMALGAALWALSKTGPLDINTPIEPSSGQGIAYWDSKNLSDLPGLLITHQVQNGQTDAGSFYWQFTHTPGSPHGYTEVTVFATLGLAAAYEANPDPNLYLAVIKAREALINGISPEGRVYELLSREGVEMYFYAGEMLEALVESILTGDIDNDGTIGFADFNILYNNWDANNCNQNCWCSGADLNRNGKVEINDLVIFCDNWLREAGYVSENGKLQDE